MHFLKALFWFLILGLATAFAVTNWHPVEIQLWSGLVADVNLSFLITLAFLLGLLPMMPIYQTVRGGCGSASPCSSARWKTCA